MKHRFLLIIIILFISIFIINDVVWADFNTTGGLGSALTNLGTVTGGSGLEKNLGTSTGTVIKGALSLVGTVFLILMVYAGILWMTASGKEEQVEKAGKIIKASIVGLFIVMSAYAITYYVTSKLGEGSTKTTTTTTTTTTDSSSLDKALTNKCVIIGGICKTAGGACDAPRISKGQWCDAKNQQQCCVPP